MNELDWQGYEPDLNEHDPLSSWPVETEYSLPRISCGWKCPGCGGECGVTFARWNGKYALEHDEYHFDCGRLHE